MEVWTTVGGIHIDNILLSHNVEEAFTYAEKTFVVKSKAENAAEDEELKEGLRRVRTHTHTHTLRGAMRVAVS